MQDKFGIFINFEKIIRKFITFPNLKFIAKMNNFAAMYKKMWDQKMKEHVKKYEQQQKQLTALKKGGKSAKQVKM